MSNDPKTPQHLDQAFNEITQEMLLTFIKKNKDYGKGNILDTGERGILFRINDKINRLKNLLGKQISPQNETIEDTWRDIAVYGVIAILLRRGWFEKLKLDPKL